MSWNKYYQLRIHFIMYKMAPILQLLVFVMNILDLHVCAYFVYKCVYTF